VASNDRFCSCGKKHNFGRTCCSFCHAPLSNKGYAAHLEKYHRFGAVLPHRHNSAQTIEKLFEPGVFEPFRARAKGRVVGQKAQD